MRNKLLIVIHLILITLQVPAEELPKILKKALSKEDTTTISNAVRKGNWDINKFLDKGQHQTLLTAAVRQSNTFMIDFILSLNPDLNQLAGGRSALQWAIRKNDISTASLLVSLGADVNLPDKNGESAVFYALNRNSYEMMKYLVEHGGSLLLTNNKGQMVFDLLTLGNSPKLIDYVKIMMSRQYAAKPFESFIEGPHVVYLEDSITNIHWFIHDSGNYALRSFDMSFENPEFPFTFQDDLNNRKWSISYHWDKAVDSVITNEPIMVVGDVHGKYDELFNLLRSAKIIDSDGNWIWAKGHLVFIGDIFDRGSKVTETLWFIYKLDRQAAAAGGAVHFILGNHEIMALLGDMNYVSPKYKMLTEYFFLNYGSMFGTNTELGRWIRSKNTMLKINDVLFVHAGISHEILQQNLSIPQMNEIVRNFLNNFKSSVTPLEGLVLLQNGPFWYRGFISEYDSKGVMTEDFIDTVLNKYNASHVVVGHSEVYSILERFNGKVYAINVPFGRENITEQLLYIENNSFYRYTELNGKESFSEDSTQAKTVTTKLDEYH